MVNPKQEDKSQVRKGSNFSPNLHDEALMHNSI